MKIYKVIYYDDLMESKYSILVQANNKKRAKEMTDEEIEGLMDSKGEVVEIGITYSSGERILSGWL